MSNLVYASLWRLACCTLCLLGSLPTFGQELTPAAARRAYDLHTRLQHVSQPSVPHGDPAVIEATNDDPCDAIALVVDGPAQTFDNLGATVLPQENLYLAVPEGEGLSNRAWFEGSINTSVWFTFVAPTSGAVTIDLCNNAGLSSFDTQVAAYAADSCGDLASFAFLGANDDDPYFTCWPQAPYVSWLDLYCLAPGETYYVLVDGFFGEEGYFSLRVSERTVTPIQFDSSVFPVDCPGDSNGAITLYISGGSSNAYLNQYAYQWSTGDTVKNLTALAPGTYTLTARAGCGDSATATFTIGYPDALAVDAGPDGAICLGDTTRLAAEVTGGAPFEASRVFTMATNDFFTTTFQHFDLHRPYQRTPIDTLPFAGFSLSGGDLIGGAFYCIYTDFLSDTSTLYAIDTATGASTPIGVLDPIDLGFGGQQWIGLALDPTAQTVYAISSNLFGPPFTQTVLCILDLQTGTVTPVDTFQNLSPYWCAIDRGGQMYVMDGFDLSLYRIALPGGGATYVGNMGNHLASDVAFDPNTNELYGIFENLDNYQTELRRIDTQTGETTFLYFLEKENIVALAIAPKGNPYTYHWVPAVTLSDSSMAAPYAFPTSSSSYLLSVTDRCGYVATDTVRIDVGQGLSATLSSTPDQGQSDGSAQATATGGLPPYSYLWSTGAITQTIFGLPTGTYTVTVSDAAGCSWTDSVTVQAIVSIDDTDLPGLSVYPNPAAERLHIRCETTTLLSLSLRDIAGRVCHEQLLSSGTHTAAIGLEGLPAGVYILQLQTPYGAERVRVIHHD